MSTKRVSKQANYGIERTNEPTNERRSFEKSFSLSNLFSRVRVARSRFRDNETTSLEKVSVIQPGETNYLRYRRIERERKRERERHEATLKLVGIGRCYLANGGFSLPSPLSFPAKLDRKPTRNLQPLRWRGLATTARRHRRGGSPRDREPPLNPAKEKRRERCLFRKLGSSTLSLSLSRLLAR